MLGCVSFCLSQAWFITGLINALRDRDGSHHAALENALQAFYSLLLLSPPSLVMFKIHPNLLANYFMLWSLTEDEDKVRNKYLSS